MIGETKQEKKNRVEESLFIEAIRRFCELSRQSNDNAIVGSQTVFKSVIEGFRKGVLSE
jgi:hypothetical protein